MLIKKDIDKLAELARISVLEEEKREIIRDLDGVLEYVSIIKTFAQKNIKKETNIELLSNTHLREDKEPHTSGVYTDEILSEAPKTKDGYVKVNKTIQNLD